MSNASLLALFVFAGQCEKAYDDVRGDLSVEDKTVLLAAVRDCRADLAAFAATVETDVLVEAGEKRYVVAGLGEVSIRKNVRRTQWDNDGLTRVIVARALDERTVDVETGEYEPAHDAVARVLSACARPSWRVTALRERGIQIDEWCVVDSDGWAVQLPPRQKEPLTRVLEVESEGSE